MCRLAGIYNKLSNDNLKNDIIRMTNSMQRGGPDGEGIYIDSFNKLALGHRRLSLLDLTDAGLQPMSSKGNEIKIVFNGEIYNFIELKDTLRNSGFSFFTNTDTEVIINAYILWGEECFSKFNGMFAIAILDNRVNKLIFARDISGIKPLYYFIDNQQLIFASEVKAFLAFNSQWEESKEWKTLFLAFGHIPEPFTTLNGVFSFPKAHYAKFDLDCFELKITKFYTFSYSEKIKTEGIAIKNIRTTLEKAVERHLIADAPIGVFLSGGIDSSILSILASKFQNNENLKTLSIIFEEQLFSEEIFQNIIAKEFNLNHVSFIVTKQMFRDSFKDILAAMDQPSLDGINSYFICKFAREYGLKAVLSGLGADELFGGYDSVQRSKVLQFSSFLPGFIFGFAKYLPIDKLKRIEYLGKNDLVNQYLFFRGIYSPSQISEILDITLSKVIDVLTKVNVPTVNIKNDQQIVAHLDQHLYMQNQLLKDTDYMSMWHGIEVRVPFLDKELINLVNAIDPGLKFNKIELPKHLLIKAFEDILPKVIWNRRKQGFSFPFNEWMSTITIKKRPNIFLFFNQKFAKGKIHWSKYWTYLVVKSYNDEFIFLDKDAKQVCFYNLLTFKKVGGIEKFNRAFLYALSQIENNGKILINSASMHDDDVEEKYFCRENYRYYSAKRLKFIFKEFLFSKKYDIYIYSHINFSFFGLMILFFNVKKEKLLIVHGIEIWRKLSFFQHLFIQSIDKVLSVSHFTKAKVVNKHFVNPRKIEIFNNTIDPFFKVPSEFSKPLFLNTRYNLSSNSKIIFSLTRLAYSEKYKGYDNVIEVMVDVIKKIPEAKYIIAGKSDKKEANRLNTLINKHNLKNHVFLIGFVPDEEIVNHYLLSDLFIMPSKKEGFGIVFIESMACGLPVISGNQDGSVDALKNGTLGKLVNPNCSGEIYDAIIESLMLKNEVREIRNLQFKVLNDFGFSNFHSNLQKQLIN